MSDHAPSDEGLTRVSLPDLQRLQRLLGAGHLPSPLDRTALQAAGVGALWDALQPYAALAPSALGLVLQAVLAERTRRPVPRLELVWTGPDPLASRARDTAVVVRDLFRSAQRSVLVAGFAFDHGQEILEPLHAVMVERGVEASLFVDLTTYAQRLRAGRGVPGEPGEAAAAAFLRAHWPFGDPTPALYYDPRTADRWTFASLHAKGVVVDEQVALVTSANFTDRGQTRNVELGVRIEDPAFARLIVHQWRSLIAAGAFRRAGGA